MAVSQQPVMTHLAFFSEAHLILKGRRICEKGGGGYEQIGFDLGIGRYREDASVVIPAKVLLVGRRRGGCFYGIGRGAGVAVDQ